LRTAKRLEVVGLVASGWSSQAAADRVGVSRSIARLWVRLAGMRLQRGRLGGLAEQRKPRVKRPRPRADAPAGPFLDSNGRLDLAGRVLIQIRLLEACSYRRIAAELGVAASTVSREIAAHVVDGKYRAVQAQQAAAKARHRTGNPKLVPGGELWQIVVAGLNHKLSPEQITGRLRLEYPDRHDMQGAPGDDASMFVKRSQGWLSGVMAWVSVR